MLSNLELVKSIYAQWEKGDFSSAGWADPEIEFAMHGGLNAGEWKGIEAMTDVWTTMLRAWVDLRAIPEELREQPVSEPPATPASTRIPQEPRPAW